MTREDTHDLVARRRSFRSRVARCMVFLLGLVPGVVVTSEAACHFSSRGGTDCYNAAGLQADFQASASSFSAALITFCRNGTCAAGYPTMVSGDPTQLRCTLSGPLTQVPGAKVECDVIHESPQAGYELEVSFLVDSIDTFHDGDAYTLTVGSIINFTTAVTYTDTGPCRDAFVWVTPPGGADAGE
jgi:hypothetical protein